ncbi:MAG: threonine synthase [Balneolaceae bacterium]|nr:threonine synthase [Balneolaceae bacterium]MCH8548217.1 threonine synthase [Balneolaceae bacterium]
MKFISTSGKAEPVSFMEAMRQGLAPDGGLYMPDRMPKMDDQFFKKPVHRSFAEIALEMAKPYLGDELKEEALGSVAEDAFNFPLELREIEPGFHVLELFHGPTLAFKDFGARFMARLFAEDANSRGEKVTILVATSGDTGSAVAGGFYDVPGVEVVVLFPKGKVSPLQQKQMTTLGKNITAIEIDGVFDDCQRLVKQAFSDKELAKKMRLSSANSINIARLLPQSFYYGWAANRIGSANKTSFITPSGNFGNLTGGLIAKEMGVPLERIVAATNSNDVVPRFLGGEEFRPGPSVQTISNAMDVGDPSNFVRMMHLFEGDADRLRREIPGYSYTDEETRRAIREVYQSIGYTLCPHTAVGYLAAKRDAQIRGGRTERVILGTAHPVKFREVVEHETGEKIPVPDRLKKVLEKEGVFREMRSDFEEFRHFLIQG